MVGTMVPEERVAISPDSVPIWQALPPEIEWVLQRLLTSHSLSVNFLKLHLLWHMEWEFYEPSTLEELADWAHCDLTDTLWALDELWAAGLVQLLRYDNREPARYALPDDDDLRARIAKFFDAYHNSDEICERIIQRFFCEDCSANC